MIPITDDVAVAPSTISGHGCFATRALPAGTMLGVARIIIDPDLLAPAVSTNLPLGKLMNHSDHPNVEIHIERQPGRETWTAWTLIPVQAVDELTVRYPTPDWMQR